MTYDKNLIQERINNVAQEITSAEELLERLRGSLTDKNTAVLKIMIADWENRIRIMYNTKRSLEHELNQCKGFPERTTPLRVMCFSAYNSRGFEMDIFAKIYVHLTKFGTFPYLKEINSRMSDVGVLFAEEDISMAEAQAIWDKMLKADHDDFQPGYILYWFNNELTTKKE